MSKQELSISIPEVVNKELLKHLIRLDGQEDLAFALWVPSYGTKRLNVLVKEVIFPDEEDRQIHGNVSFNSHYFKRVCREAMQKGMGVCFLHSHPYPGWQGMSTDDVKAEKKMAPVVSSLTGIPLIGMTVGSDGTWSARSWEHIEENNFKKRWASCVKSVGSLLKVNFTEFLVPEPEFREFFKRTRTVFGDKKHKDIARLKVGIVGLGSVGFAVAESLARMGIERFTLIDFDKVEMHNLDRLQGVTTQDIGQHKVFIAERQIKTSSTAGYIEVDAVPESVTSRAGYQAALNCDVLFSCVDKPRARNILNHIAYAHLIPVIDGGIKVRINEDGFLGAEWQVQTATPGRPCLECLKAYDMTDVYLEKEGLLENSSYLEGMGESLETRTNENIYPFSVNLASMEVFQFMALAAGVGDLNDFGVQRFRFNQGIISSYKDKVCKENCDFKRSLAVGDKYLRVYDEIETEEI